MADNVQLGTPDPTAQIAATDDVGGIQYQKLKPMMTSGGNVSVQTAATGTNYTTFASQACKQLTIVNDTGTKLEVQQGATGVALRILDGMAYTFFGLSNASSLGVRRADTSNTQVTATARWET